MGRRRLQGVPSDVCLENTYKKGGDGKSIEGKGDELL